MRALKIFLFTLAFCVTEARAENLIFVVNKENPITEITLEELSDYYFKRRLRWPSGTKVQFIDQKENSPRKELFLSLIGKTQREVDLIWISEKNLSGSSAPLRAPSDSMVVSMVASLAGGLSYVSDSHANFDKVKRIQVKKHE